MDGIGDEMHYVYAVSIASMLWTQARTSKKWQGMVYNLKGK